MGPPSSQLRSADDPPLWFGDNDIIPLKEDVEKAAVPEVMAAASPTASDAARNTALGQGEVNGGDVQQGDVYQGDVYQGDVYQGDVYQGDSALPPPPSGMQAKSAAEDDPPGVPLRGLLFGIFAGTAAAAIWYGLTVATGWQLGLVSWLVGIGVGIGVVAGTGRGGTDTALIAASITALALLVGEFQIAKYYEAQEEVYEEQAAAVERDGDYTDEEVAILAGMSLDDFTLLSGNEKNLLRTLVQMSDEDYADEDYADEDYDDPYDMSGDPGVDEDDWPESLSFGFFLGNLKLFLGWKGIIIWLIGVGAAFRIGVGKTD